MTEDIRLEEQLHQADHEIKDGQYVNAVMRLEGMIRERPDFGKAYNHLGFLYETKFKDYEKAEGYYKLALQHSPNYPAVYLNYSILLSTKGKFDDLHKLLEKALTVTGIDKATIYNEYGIMFEQLEEYDKAIKYYTDCAKTTFNNDVLNRAQDSIQRCKTKIDLGSY